MNARSTRALPMAPDARRRAILDVVIPRLIEKGASLTTAEMAEAAGIAEGTIFRVFADKAALILEAVRVAIDAAPVAGAVAAIDPALARRAQLREVAQLLIDHYGRMIALAELLRSMHDRQHGRPCDVRELVRESSATITQALTGLFGRFANSLRVPVPAAIAALRGLVMASVHPVLPARERLSVEDLVDILESGIALPDSVQS